MMDQVLTFLVHRLQAKEAPARYASLLVIRHLVTACGAHLISHSTPIPTSATPASAVVNGFFFPQFIPVFEYFNHFHCVRSKSTWALILPIDLLCSLLLSSSPFPSYTAMNLFADKVLTDKKAFLLSSLQVLMEEPSYRVRKAILQVIIGMADAKYLNLEGGQVCICMSTN